MASDTCPVRGGNPEQFNPLPLTDTRRSTIPWSGTSIWHISIV
nr:hypothetical protein [Candidatus Sigynarchaeota archaeon]